MPEDSPKLAWDETDSEGGAATQPSDADIQTTHTEDDGAPPSVERIGPYRLIRELGKGGMGTVYLASRTDAEFHKQVALKVVTAETARSEVIARFQRERRILSSLEHPNIARLLDGGASDDGRPYIVMDYVKGLPLNEHCDRSKLLTTERLKLFRQVCSAVQYAHGNLIVHRDLKPRNVLVSTEGVPKLLDFGIAKLLNPDLWGDASQTGTGLGPFTPEFASPEQVRGDPITTATDVYALGVLLYVLLTGRLPYRLKARLPLEILKAVTDQEPERPSAAVTRPGVEETVSDLAPLRGASEGTTENLKARLQGDLDAILLTALRKEPEHRYRSVEALSEDIRRHLEGLPVRARKGTFSYRASKFVRRHRTGVVATALFGVLLVSFTIALAVQSATIAAERDRSEAARLEAERVAETNAAINRFLIEDMIGSAAPGIAQGRSITVDEVLENAAARVDSALTGQPGLEAAVRQALGNTYLALGRLEDAEGQLGEAVRLRRTLLGMGHELTLHAIQDLAAVLSHRDRQEEAQELLATAVQTSRRIRGEADRLTLRAESLLALTMLDQAQYEESEVLLRRVLARQIEVLGEDHEDTLNSMNSLGLLLFDVDRLEEAETVVRRALELREKSLGEDHPTTLSSMNNLANILDVSEKLDEAGDLHERVFEARRRVLGDEHPDTLDSMNNLAIVFRKQGAFERAESVQRELLEVRGRVLGERHFKTLTTMANLSIVLRDRDKLEDAERLLRRLVDLSLEELGSDHWLVWAFRGDFGDCLLMLGRYEEAERYLLESYQGVNRLLGAEHRMTADRAGLLVKLYEAWSRPEEAAEYRALLERTEQEAAPVRAGASEG